MEFIIKLKYIILYIKPCLSDTKAYKIFRSTIQKVQISPPKKPAGKIFHAGQKSLKTQMSYINIYLSTKRAARTQRVKEIFLNLADKAFMST